MQKELSNIKVRVRKDWTIDFLTRQYENKPFIIQSSYNLDKNDAELSYYHYFILMMFSYHTKIEDVLIMWHWWWSTTKLIEKYFPESKIDSVELSSEMISLTKKHLSFWKNVNIIQWDALDYIDKCDKKYDVVIYDIFDENWDVIWFDEKQYKRTIKNIKKVTKKKWIFLINAFKLDFNLWLHRYHKEWKSLENLFSYYNMKCYKNIYELCQKLYWEEVSVISDEHILSNRSVVLWFWFNKELKDLDLYSNYYDNEVFKTEKRNSKFWRICSNLISDQKTVEDFFKLI